MCVQFIGGGCISELIWNKVIVIDSWQLEIGWLAVLHFQSGSAFTGTGKLSQSWFMF